MDKLYPWETEVDVSGLAPGTYTFVAMTDDPSGGEGGGPTEDSKTIIVCLRVRLTAGGSTAPCSTASTCSSGSRDARTRWSGT